MLKSNSGAFPYNWTPVKEAGLFIKDEKQLYISCITGIQLVAYVLIKTLTTIRKLISIVYYRLFFVFNGKLKKRKHKSKVRFASSDQTTD